MSQFKSDNPIRGLYPASHPATKEYVTSSDRFYLGRLTGERNQVFLPVYFGESSDSLNVNTDKLRHRPSDIMDYTHRSKPLPSLKI